MLTFSCITIVRAVHYKTTPDGSQELHRLHDTDSEHMESSVPGREGRISQRNRLVEQLRDFGSLSILLYDTWFCVKKIDMFETASQVSRFVSGYLQIHFR